MPHQRWQLVVQSQINPSAGPSDNGTVSSIAILSKGKFHWRGNGQFSRSGHSLGSSASRSSHDNNSCYGQLWRDDRCDPCAERSDGHRRNRRIESPDGYIGPGTVITITQPLLNLTASASAASFSATIPEGLILLPGGCQVTVELARQEWRGPESWSGLIAERRSGPS
jgi:hypothetical protein